MRHVSYLPFLWCGGGKSCDSSGPRIDPSEHDLWSQIAESGTCDQSLLGDEQLGGRKMVQEQILDKSLLFPIKV